MIDLKRPTISIIVPVYNVEEYLKGCLESILNQTFADFEVICVDDGSPDNSISILKEFATRDRRIQVIRQINQGLSVSRNNAMNIAKGKYIFFVDSDDYIAPRALEVLYNAIIESGVDVICANYCSTTELYTENLATETADCKIETVVFDKPLDAYFSHRNKFGGIVWNKLYQAEILQDIRFIPGRLFEDEVFTLLVMEKCCRVAHINYMAYHYFYNPKAISKRKIDSIMLDNLLKNAEFLCEHFAVDNVNRKIVRKHKVKAILSMCYKKIKMLEVAERKPLFAELGSKVRAMKTRGLIRYSDFDIEGKLKLFRLLN